MSTGNARSSQFTGTLNAFATDTGGGDFYPNTFERKEIKENRL
jgi:hypothetical protein